MVADNATATTATATASGAMNLEVLPAGPVIVLSGVGVATAPPQAI